MKFILLILIILLAPLASAASIYGNIYDLELNKLTNVLVTINTEPMQKHLSTDGSYQFSLEPGKYTIKAEQAKEELYTEENITITKEGNYSFDLFLLPDLSESDEIEEGILIADEPKSSTYLYFLLIIPIALIIAFLLILKRKKENKQEDNLTEQIIKAIKDGGGRISQKELRKKFPFSEAKISLVITELEHKNRIEKIKRGRSNVLILKK